MPSKRKLQPAPRWVRNPPPDRRPAALRRNWASSLRGRQHLLRATGLDHLFQDAAAGDQALGDVRRPGGVGDKELVDGRIQRDRAGTGSKAW